MYKEYYTQFLFYITLVLLGSKIKLRTNKDKATFVCFVLFYDGKENFKKKCKW